MGPGSSQGPGLSFYLCMTSLALSLSGCSRLPHSGLLPCGLGCFSEPFLPCRCMHFWPGLCRWNPVTCILLLRLLLCTLSLGFSLTVPSSPSSQLSLDSGHGHMPVGESQLWGCLSRSEAEAAVYLGIIEGAGRAGNSLIFKFRSIYIYSKKFPRILSLRLNSNTLFRFLPFHQNVFLIQDPRKDFLHSPCLFTLTESILSPFSMTLTFL